MAILIKISGDLTENRKVLDEIKEISKTDDVSLIYGFGTKLSNECYARHIGFYYVKGIRVFVNENKKYGLELALKISKEVKDSLSRELGDKIELISPVNVAHGEITNTNADEILINEGHKYSKIILYTLKGRDKEELFSKFSDKIEVRYI